MKANNPDRKFTSDRIGLYFKYLSDQDIQEVVVACQEELELRSQEHMTSEPDLLKTGSSHE
jgi:hypothetical protein